jgi:ATP-dependent Lon protease
VTRRKDRPEFKPQDLPGELPILPLRNSVFFPGAVMPLTIGRAKTIRLIEDATRENSLLGIVTQRAPEIDDPVPDDLYEIGTAARIIKLARTGKDGFNIVVEGISRFRVDDFTQEEPFFTSKITPLADEGTGDVEVEALALNLKNTAREVIDMLPEIPVMAKQLLESIQAPGHLADLITANIDATIEEKQEVLEAVHLKVRLKRVLELLSRQFEVMKLSNKINSQVKGEMSKTQREYYLRQQLKAIKEELGDKDDDEASKSSRAASRTRTCPRTRPRRPSASSSGCATCSPARPSTRSRAPTSSGSPICRGTSRARTTSTSTTPSSSSTTTTTGWRRSRSASSSTSPSASSRTT